MQSDRCAQMSRTVHLETGMTMVFGCRVRPAATVRSEEEDSRLGQRPGVQAMDEAAPPAGR